MKSGILLSAAASMMMLGSTAVFAQSYAAPGAVTLKPGQIQSTQPSFHAPGFTTSANVGVVTLKPGETTATSMPADYGAVQAGATSVAAPFVTLKPGQAN